MVMEWTIPVPSVVILVSVVLVLSCGQTDRQTDRGAWSLYSRYTVGVINNDDFYGDITHKHRFKGAEIEILQVYGVSDTSSIHSGWLV